MIVENKKTGRSYPITETEWAKICAAGKRDAYTIIAAPEAPKEVKEKIVRAPKGDKNTESDHNGIIKTDDRLPGEDVGEIA